MITENCLQPKQICKHQASRKVTTAEENAHRGALEAALTYAADGWAVFPVRVGRKEPLTEHGLKDATTDSGQIRSWWGKWPNANIGLLAPGDVLVLDLDCKNGKDGLATLNARAPEGDELSPETWPGPWQETPTGGAHVVMRWPNGVPRPPARAELLPGVDGRGLGKAYVVVAPSTVGAGSYRWVNPLGPVADVPPAPGWVVDLLRPPERRPHRPQTRRYELPRDLTPYIQGALEGEAQAVRDAPVGKRNHTLNAAAFNLGQLAERGLGRDEAEAVLLAANDARAEPLPEREARRTFDSGWNAGAAKPRDVPERTSAPPDWVLEDDAPPPTDADAPPELLAEAPAERPATKPTGKEDLYSDLYNARRLARENADRLMYCGTLGGWHVWDGARWLRSENGAEAETAKALAKVILAEAEKLLKEAERKAASAKGDAKQQANAAKKRTNAIWWNARHAQTNPGVQAMLKLAQSEPAVSVGHAQVDADPWALNCPNGLLDLRTGKLRPHRPSDRVTKLTGCAYDPEAAHPLWDEFLARILPEQQVREFLQRLVGYALTGVIRDHILPIFYGTGANGKTVLVNTLSAMLGDYAGTVPTEVIAPAAHNEPHPTGRARLRGLRLAVASETDRTAKLAVATVKSLTGGDTVVARFMRQDYFEFEPTHKLVLVTNHRPIITDQGDAIWRRVILVPFDVSIPKDEQDRDLTDKLRAELPGILAWAVQGCRAWQDQGLAIPPAVSAATDEYRAAEDTLGDFITERLEISKEAVTLAKKLHDEYKLWAQHNDLNPVGPKKFYRMLDERGYRRGPKQSGGITFRGLKLRTR